MKRLFDLLASAIGLLILAVPLALLAWQVRRKLGTYQAQAGIKMSPILCLCSLPATS